MAKRRSKARQTRDEAREAYLAAAAHLWDEFNGWYDAHPDATFLEMELELRKHRRVLMGETLELTLRRGDLGASATAQQCERCGREMKFKGYPDKEVRGLEGEATRRAAGRRHASCWGCLGHRAARAPAH